MDQRVCTWRSGLNEEMLELLKMEICSVADPAGVILLKEDSQMDETGGAKMVFGVGVEYLAK